MSKITRKIEIVPDVEGLTHEESNKKCYNTFYNFNRKLYKVANLLVSQLYGLDNLLPLMRLQNEEYVDCQRKLSFKSTTDVAKEEIKKIMKNLGQEISDKIDKEKEKVLLTTLTTGDKQSNNTKAASGRPQTKSNVITAAIKQKTPFRSIISQVCEKAEQLPMIQLRKQKGKKLKE